MQDVCNQYDKFLAACRQSASNDRTIRGFDARSEVKAELGTKIKSSAFMIRLDRKQPNPVDIELKSYPMAYWSLTSKN